METQSLELARRLIGSGWEIVRRDADALPWWADEIWYLESTWASRTPVFLTFLVDPQAEGQRKRGEKVWAVGASGTYPDDRHCAASVTLISLGRGWQAEIPALFEALQRYRLVAEMPEAMQAGV